MIKSFITVLLTVTFAVSAHADDMPTYDNAAECIGMLEFLALLTLSLIHISEPTRQAEISYAVFCLKKKK